MQTTPARGFKKKGFINDSIPTDNKGCCRLKLHGEVSREITGFVMVVGGFHRQCLLLRSAPAWYSTRTSSLFFHSFQKRKSTDSQSYGKDGSGDWSVVQCRTRDRKVASSVESRQKRRVNFLLQCQPSVPTRILVFVRVSRLGLTVRR